MTIATTRLMQCLLAGVVGAGVLLLDDRVSLNGSSLMSSAGARIGRPPTPLSYAGVARRTTRRAVAVGAAAGAVVVVPPPVVVAPVVVPAPVPVRRCVQTVDAYGRIHTRCY